jgi:hypothetical protein
VAGLVGSGFKNKCWPGKIGILLFKRVVEKICQHFFGKKLVNGSLAVKVWVGGYKIRVSKFSKIV